MTAEADRSNPRRGGFAPTQLEREGIRLDTGAPVTGATVVGKSIAAGLGDGTILIFEPDNPPKLVEAHHGAILCITANQETGAIFTGGDDGRFLKTSLDGTVEEIASFGSRWVDCVATGPKLFACSSGKTVTVWSEGETQPRTFENPSTVGGLAFDEKGRRMAVSHYGGAKVWERGSRRWESISLKWKGSHGAVTFSPDGKCVVTSMQENAMHGWRLRDKADMRMSGYPAKVKAFIWMGSAPFLATSGADEAICWPFDGKNGPMGRSPATCCYGGKQVCTAVTGLLGHDALLAGFADGAVLAGQASEDADDFVVKGSSGSPIAALAITSDAWLFVGEESGRILWVRLGGNEK